MTDTATSAPFASFEALLARNDELLASTESSGQSLGSVSNQTIADFMASAAATGAVIAASRDRRKAQAIINFWAAELITRDKSASEWSAPQLAAAERGAERSGDGSISSNSAVSDPLLARSRAQVRISASARQWRASDNDAGWLLSGDALREAEQFIGEDDDIRALVVASHAAEHKATRRFRLSLGSITLVLAVLCVWLFMALQQSRIAEKTATLAEKAATTARDDQARAAAASNQILQNALAEQAQRARDQQQEFDRLQEALKQVAPLIKRAQAAGQVADSEIPVAMRPILDALEQKALPGSSPLPADLSLMRGYDPTFLQAAAAGSKSSDGLDGGIAVPFPKLTGSALTSAYDNGRRIDYVNFSVVLNKARRAPSFAAVNLQRSAIVPLLRANVQFQYDPRIPPDVQSNPQAFGSSEIDRGQLVNAREIAWGSAFGTDAVAAGRTAYAMVSVMTNVTPQFDTFNRGLWLDAERYAREEFSRLSDRITIFTGPVLADDDPLISGLSLPRRFWKVLVATSPDNAASLVVEAYLISQFGSAGKVPMGTKFFPDIYRVRVTDIERLAGLDFGEIVRGADRYWLSTPIQLQKVAQVAIPGSSELTDRLQAITGPDRSARTSAMQQLLDAIRGPGLGDGNLRKLIEGIVALASDKSFASLEPEARVNVLTLLAAVPKERWDADGSIDLKAAARRAVADATATLGCPGTGATQACAQVALLKPQLGWDLASGRTIYFQFAGMVRDDAKVIADKLKTLGWSIPGEERTGTAAGYNEVRYGDDDDRRAAELLAADLRALGRSGVRAKKTSGVKPKFPEIFISI
jgi:DNA/RNA endonuclease G (NUC1)